VRKLLVCYFTLCALAFSPLPAQAENAVLQQLPQMSEQHSQEKLNTGLIASLIVISLIGVAGCLWNYKRGQAARRQDNLALEKSVRQLAAAQRIGQIGYWRMRPDSQTFEFSEEVFELFDLDGFSNPVPYDQILPLVHPDDRAATELYMERAHVTCEPIRFEFRIVSPNRNTYFISGESKLETDEITGHPSVFGIFQDVTARKNSEKAHRASEKKFRVLLDEALQGIYVHRRGELLYANQALIDMLAYDDAEDLFQIESVADLIAPQDIERLTGYMQCRLRGEEAPSSYEARYMCKDGSIFWAELLISSVDWDGEEAFQVFITDITSRQDAEEAQRQSQKMEAIGQLTGGVAHDFNNLLAVIIGNLDMAKFTLSQNNNTDLEGIGDLIQRALASANKGAGLTGQLLAFARKQNLQPSSATISKMLPDLHDMLARILPENIVLGLKVDNTVSDITADANQLTNALLNLAINARDAMPHGGALNLAARNIKREDIKNTGPEEIFVENLVEISVSDTGVGMTKQILDQAFEPFYTTKDVGEGTGLGLSIVFGFARQSGGFAAIESEPDVGTTVRIYVPTQSTLLDESNS
jgi:PAS domain S-box-containing protein